MRAAQAQDARTGVSGGAKPPVVLVTSGCSPLTQSHVRRQLAIELHADVTDAERAVPGVTAVTIACREDEATITVEDALTQKSLNRQVDLRNTATKARDRFLALAATELVTASWLELEAEPVAVTPPPARTPQTLAQAAEARSVVEARVPRVVRPRERAGLRVGGFGRWVPVTAQLTWGAGLGFARELSPRWALRLSVAAETGSQTLDVGDGDTQALTAALEAVARSRWSSPWVGRASAGFRAGLARLEGRSFDSATQGSSAVGAIAGPVATAALARTLGSAFELELAAEVGYAVKDLVGTSPRDEARRTGFRGPWLTLGLGVAWSL